MWSLAMSLRTVHDQNEPRILSIIGMINFRKWGFDGPFHFLFYDHFSTLMIYT